MLDWQLGVCPTPKSGSTNDASVRDGETFAALEAEISKLTDLHGQSTTDWKQVAQLAAVLLREEGKDLSVAVWLLLAWLHCEGVQGLAAGIRVLRDVHEHHWETMTPPVTRLRGRRNQMEWLIHQLEKELGRLDATNVPLSQEQHEALMADWNKLDQIWQQKDDQAPAIFKLRNTLMETGVAADTEPVIGSGDEPDPAVESTGPVVQEHDTVASQPAPQKQADAVVQDVQDGADLDTEAAVERVVDEGLAAVHASLQDLPDPLMLLPLLYRFNRLSAWLVLDALPPAPDDVSGIPAPSSAEQDALQRLVEAGDVLSVLRFVESRVATHRFWLDLHRIAYQAAQSLPQGQPAADAIAFETQCLLRRLPGIVTISFANGQPFADAATRDWIATLGAAAPAAPASVQPATSLTPAQPVVAENTLGMATLLVAARAEAQAAAQLLDGVVARLQSGSEQFIQR